MGRSGYNEDCIDNWALIKWRGQVASAIRGKRGQDFLRELIEALDSLPEKKLIADKLQDTTGRVCALGAVGLKRGVDMSELDVDDYDTLSGVFGVAHQMVQEIAFMNDECAFGAARDEFRWEQMRQWAINNLKVAEPPAQPDLAKGIDYITKLPRIIFLARHNIGSALFLVAGFLLSAFMLGLSVAWVQAGIKYSDPACHLCRLSFGSLQELATEPSQLSGLCVGYANDPHRYSDA